VEVGVGRKHWFFILLFQLARWFCISDCILAYVAVQECKYLVQAINLGIEYNWHEDPDHIAPFGATVMVTFSNSAGVNVF